MSERDALLAELQQLRAAQKKEMDEQVAALQKLSEQLTAVSEDIARLEEEEERSLERYSAKMMTLQGGPVGGAAASAGSAADEGLGVDFGELFSNVVTGLIELNEAHSKLR